MLAGGDITITADTITNQYSEIAANGDIALNAAAVSNTGQDLVETVVTQTVSNYRERYCALRILGICLDRDWRNRSRTTTTRATATTGAVFASIQAGGALSAHVTGYLGNNAVRSNAAQIGLSSGGRAIAAPSGVGAINPDIILGRTGLFQPTNRPDAPFLIETRPEFIDISAFLSSDYFFDRIEYDANLVQRRFGDAYVEARLIQEQLFALTGRRLAGSTEELRALLKALYDNAASATEALALTPGVALTAEQVVALTADIIWMEEQEIDGQTVLVPVVYLSGDTLDETMLASAQISGATTELNAGSLGNSGAITGTTGLRIATGGDLVNSGGVLASDGDVGITAGGRFANISGQVSGEDVTIAADSVENSTAVLRDETAIGFNDRAQQTARIDAAGNLNVTAAGDMTAIGGQFSAGEDATLDAGGNIALGAAQRETRREESFADGYDNSYRLENDLAGITAGGNVSIGAGGDLFVLGAEISAGGDAALTADGDIAIASVQDMAQDDMVFDIDSGGLFGVETDIRRQNQQVTTSRSTITAGGDVDVASSGGDVTLQAAGVESGGTTTLSAEEGRVAMLTTKDSTFERDERREEDLFWWNESDQGQSGTTRTHVEVEAGGGLKIVSGGDVVVEYVPTGNLDEGLAQLATAPGLAWMGDLRARNDVDWVAVETAFDEWDYESQGLTEAGALFVTAVTTFVLGPGIDALAANLAGGIGGGAAVEAAIGAGLTSLSNQTAVALVNTQGDLGAALEQVMSDGSLRSLVTAMVSAGLSDHLTTVSGIVEPTAGTATALDTLRYEMQSGLISASVNATISTAVNGGDLGDNLLDGWTNAMVMAGLAGTQHRIGDFALEHGIDDGSIGHAVAHAVAGGLAAEALGRDFADGALGAALAALASTAIGESGLSDDRQAELQNLIVTTAILVTSEGDVAGASLAGEIAASLQNNNYLNHAEAVERQEILDALWACNDSGTCSDAEIAALQEDYRRMNALDEARDLALREACGELYSSACAVELNRLNVAFESYTEAYRNGEIAAPGVFNEYALDGGSDGSRSVVALHAQYRQAFLRNAFVEAIMTLPVEAAGDAVDLATITARAAAGDQTAQNQLVVLRDSVVASITDPVGTVEAGFEQVAARMEEASRLEAAGDWRGAADIIGEVSAGFVYAATGVGGTAAAGTRVLSWVPDPTVRVARRDGAVAVDTSRATRGTPEYELLNNPPANAHIELDNGTAFRTNDAGYVEEITYTPVNQPGVRDSRQTAVGREGIAGDVGGHIQACRHGGTCDRFNLFPQNSNFNNSAYRSWENEITRGLQNGDDVGAIAVRFDRANPNSARPDAVRIEYSINGVPETRRFVNQVGGGQ
jgi:filamentous hemagglutinin